MGVYFKGDGFTASVSYYYSVVISTADSIFYSLTYYALKPAQFYPCLTSVVPVAVILLHKHPMLIQSFIWHKSELLAYLPHLLTRGPAGMLS
jgi:hypothetical protein